jgi:hypothetical protein
MLNLRSALPCLSLLALLALTAPPVPAAAPAQPPLVIESADSGADEKKGPPPVEPGKSFPLSFEISPPLDWRGKPWRAIVLRADTEGGGRPAFVFNELVGADGRFTVNDKAPGVFRVDVLDSRSSSLSSTEHDVRQPDAGPRVLRIDWIPVKGTLKLGKAPLVATLAFGGRAAPVSIRMRPEDDGTFEGVLTHGGEWLVEIESSQPDVHVKMQAEVRAQPSGPARIAIVLPPTRIFGRVVDEHGEPVVLASVTFENGSFSEDQSTDLKGKFELNGLPEGPLSLSALDTGDGATSDRQQVQLAAGKPVGPIELKLRPAARR